MKKVLSLILLLFFFLFASKTFAQGNSFVSVINPVRGDDFWAIQNQKPETAVLGQIEILTKFNLSATWLVRFDALGNKTIIDDLKGRSDEKGLFLEITPSLAEKAGVLYRKSNSWHAAGSAFLTGYEREEREKLIDSAFGKFKDTFNLYPVSVGAWWIDAYSLGYMQKKYGITGALIVADQYSTDNYQIWGQYFSTPYYPSSNNVLHPAQNEESKLQIVITQWAARDPVNSYGNGVFESTFSVQANDYIDYHKLDSSYFSKILDIYTNLQFNKFGHIVVGLENSYPWEKYKDEYEKQLEILVKKQNENQIKIVSQKDFSLWYKQNFPNLSPEQIVVADDPLGSFKKTVWYMNPYFRVGWFANAEGSVFRDIRQYIDGEEELCFKSRCDSVNFATSATRVLDDVSFGHKWVIDQGKISNFQVTREKEKFVIRYKNEAGTVRSIEFLPRDIGIDGKISSIDKAILDVVKKENPVIKSNIISDNLLKWSFLSVVLKIGGFVIFLIFAAIIPGFIIAGKIFKKEAPLLLKLFISLVIGLVIFTLLFYVAGLFKIKPLIYVYFLVNLIIFIRFKFYSNLFVNLPKINKSLNLIPVIILAGTIFQVIPVFKSGLTFGYGTGFWGPNTHDGTWHMALVNQLIKSVPPENPIYSGVVLKNYHFFYDLLIAATNYFSTIPITDLLFRFYPVIFSLMLGIGSYYLIARLTSSKIACFFSLYLIYFAGSFGWIVEFLRERHLGGESAFWMNQSVSFNLNPPYAVSVIILIALLHILFDMPKSLKNRHILLAVILAGSLIGFKSYGAILVLASIFLAGLIKKKLEYLLIFAGGLLISALIFLPNFDATSNLLIFAPFWFIHSMIDSPDRVGWVRLTLMRETGYMKNNWFKIITAEGLSLILFIIGNLGLRVVSLLLFFRIKRYFLNINLFFIFIFAILSFLIPILFIQSGNPWNTIQFAYYGLYIAAVLSGIVFSKVVKLSKYFIIPVIIIILVLAPINSMVTARGYLSNNPQAFVSSKELEGLRFLSDQSNGVVLTYPYDNQIKTKLSEPWPILVYDSTAYVSAYSKKSIYLEDEAQNQILLTDYKKRLVASKDFFQKPTREGVKFLQDNNIKYIYIPKIFNVRLDNNVKEITNIFENEEVVMYKLNSY